MSKYRLSDLQKRMLVACCKEGKLWRSEIATKCGYSYKKGSEKRDNIECAITRSLRNLLMKGLIEIVDCYYDKVSEDEVQRLKALLQDEKHFNEYCDREYALYSRAPAWIKRTIPADPRIFKEQQRRQITDKIEYLENEIQNLSKHTKVKTVSLTKRGLAMAKVLISSTVSVITGERVNQW